MRAARIVAAALVLGACTAPRGHLVVVGSGIQECGPEVFERVLELGGPDCRVAVLPTGRPSIADAVQNVRAVEAFDAHAGRACAELVPIEALDVVAAEDAALADRIRAADAVYFIGGQQWRILDTLRPDGRDTAALRAVREVVARGGVLAGGSAGAAMQSDPMIRGGSSHAALREGASFDGKGGVAIRQGTGLFPYGIIGQHFLERGRLGRLVVALDATRVRRGFGVDRGRAMVVDLTTDRIDTVGSHALVLVDMGGVERRGPSFENVRISLLGDGDSVGGRTGRITIADTKSPLPPPDTARDTIRFARSPWAEEAILEMIRALARLEAGCVEAADDEFLVRISRDGQSELWGAGSELETLSAVKLRLDLVGPDQR